MSHAELDGNSPDCGGDDDAEEFNSENYDGEEWVVSPEELRAGDFSTLEDAEDAISE